MRKVELSMEEQYKYKIIKNLVDNNGNKKNAATKLNCTVRHVNRLIKLYKEKGKEGFIHGNRGRVPSNAFDQETKEKIINLYLNEYGDTNFVHFTEIIKEDLGINISDTTVNFWLREVETLSPKAKRKTKKLMKRKLRQLLAKTKSEKVKNEIKEAISILDSKEAHPRRPRCKYAGEMIQMDASSFNWVPNEVWHLHLAIDDATGEVVGAYFDYQETLNGYYNVFYQILNNYGIPAMFYTDRRTVFEYKRKNTAFDDDDTFTQFSYACHQLGVEIKTTSVAQAKGRIERLNQTFQSRLPVELRRAQITNIEEANEFLKSYLKKFNAHFALHLNTTKSVYEKQPTTEQINQVLAVISERKIGGGHAIKYKNKYYIPKTKADAPVYFNKGTTCLIIEAFDGKQYLNVLDTLYHMEEIPKHQTLSENFDPKEKKEAKERKHYIPPLTHPWRQASCFKYFSSQPHRENNANV